MSDIPEAAVKAAAEALTHRDWRRRAPWDEGYTLNQHTDSPEDHARQVADHIDYELGRARAALEAAMPHIQEQWTIEMILPDDIFEQINNGLNEHRAEGIYRKDA